MAATNLNTPTRPVRTGWLPEGLPRAWATTYAGIWGATILFAAIDFLTGPWLAELGGASERFHHSPTTTPAPSVVLVALLSAVNWTRSVWPLALGAIGAHRDRITTVLADLLLVVFLARNTLWVGTALGAYSTSILAYLPQLPVEWAALALGTSGWLIQRKRPVSSREVVVWATLTAVVVLCAGVIETYGVPHR